MKRTQPIDMEHWTFHDSTFCREIRRVNRNRILLGVVLFALIFYFDTMSTIYRVRLAYSEPQPVTHAELSAITDPLVQLTPFGFSANFEESAEFEENLSLKRLMYAQDGVCLVTLTPLDYTPVEIVSGDNSYVEYALGRLDTGKYILVKRSSVVKLDSVTGTVGYLPADLRAIILDNAAIDKDQLCPLIFDATAETFSSVTTEIIFSVFLLLVWGVWFFFVIRRSLSVQRDPAYKRLFVCHGSVEDNARQIDEELNGVDSYSAGRTTVTENWHLRRRLFSFLAEPRSSAE